MDLEGVGFFTTDGDVLIPTPMAQSLWKADQMHGVAISGALARTAERTLSEAERDDLQPARVTVDLFRVATMKPCHLSAEVVREGPRIALIDVMLTQAGQRVARAGVLFLKPTASPAGKVWEPKERFGPPPYDVAPPTDDPHVPFFHSDAGWSQSFGDHQNAGHKMSWNSVIPLVVGEPITPFQGVAAIADGASLVTNWGSGGVEFINTDITLSLSRVPVGNEIGLAALDRTETDGVAVGVAAVFDRQGPLGNVTVTSLVNSKRTVDLGGVEFDDDGQRRVANQ